MDVFKQMINALELVHKFDEPLNYKKVRYPIHKINNVLVEPIDGLNIVNTQQLRQLEFYGWGSPVKPHVDGSGVIFFCPIYKEFPNEVVCAGDIELDVEIGGVYMLDDNVEHETRGEGHTISMFLGPYQSTEVTPELIAHVIETFREGGFN